ncbi:hypothetical protein A9A59_2021 [Tepidiforma thermophila]|uniref:Uncharacterized protein n=1 Tax=Tepidiforma thermophila (strain KCTC 52669 / CGMCC 1.13589 / G233) TaxID=2761530 RepID=A0A2A9HI47_TEPT2|nr:hypothetical protein A9A59_2021 [Tepidiforma thermophila]
MSPARRRRRPHGSPATPGTAQPAPAAQAARPIPLPEWKWRTFPVFFAFALGGFLGLYMGLWASLNDTAFLLASVTWAVLLGAGFSRLSTRWILSRRWTRAQRRKR